MKYIKSFFLLLFCLVLVFPFVFVIVGSTHDSSWAFSSNISFSIGTEFYNNVKNVVDKFSILKALLNSLYVATMTSSISVIVIFLAAYAFKVYQFKFKKALYIILITAILIPLPATLIGQLKVLNELGFYGTLSGIIIPFIINIRVFVYLNNVCHFMPKSFLEAGRIDGANEFKILYSIVLPYLKDKLLLSFFLLFVASWNNFLIPMIIIGRRELFTLPITISSIADPMRYDIGATLAALLFSILPIIALFFVFQKKVFNSVDVTSKN